MLWLSTLLATSAFADEKQAEACVQTQVWDAYGDGWGVRTLTSTSLEAGRTKSYLVTLYAGNDYKIGACGDDDVTELDILLYDAEGKLLLRDDVEGRNPSVTYQPKHTNTYYVVLYPRSTKKAGVSAGVGMAVTYR